jgi:predicted lipoprotein with Yx(FWY)xxD motif
VATTAAPQSAAPATTAPPTTARPAATPTTAPAAPSGTVALQVANSSHGPILIDAANRHTVYLFTQDRGTTSACTGACSIYWPAVKAPAHPVGGPGVDNSKISVSNGQLVYNGHLLYMYSGDSAPGQVNGANVPDWYPVNPSGNQA